jgi:hypothetical protein
MKSIVIVCFCAVAFAAVGCVDGRGVPTGPAATAEASTLATTAPANRGTVPQAAAPSLSASPRGGDLHITKECSAYTGLAGSYCTITSSNVKAIEVGTRVVYAEAAGATLLDSDVVLDTPGPGNNTVCLCIQNRAPRQVPACVMLFTPDAFVKDRSRMPSRAA